MPFEGHGRQSTHTEYDQQVEQPTSSLNSKDLLKTVEVLELLQSIRHNTEEVYADTETIEDLFWYGYARKWEWERGNVDGYVNKAFEDRIKEMRTHEQRAMGELFKEVHDKELLDFLLSLHNVILNNPYKVKAKEKDYLPPGAKEDMEKVTMGKLAEHLFIGCMKTFQEDQTAIPGVLPLKITYVDPASTFHDHIQQTDAVLFLRSFDVAPGVAYFNIPVAVDVAFTNAQVYLDAKQNKGLDQYTVSRVNYQKYHTNETQPGYIANGIRFLHQGNKADDTKDLLAIRAVLPLDPQTWAPVLLEIATVMAHEEVAEMTPEILKKVFEKVYPGKGRETLQRATATMIQSLQSQLPESTLRGFVQAKKDPGVQAILAKSFQQKEAEAYKAYRNNGRS